MLFYTVLVLLVDTVIITASVAFDIIPPVILIVWLLLASLAVIALGGGLDD